MHKLAVSFLILSGLLLTACGRLEVPVNNPPPEPLTTCLADPEPPEGNDDGTAVGLFMLDLWGAGDDCRRKLAALVAFLLGGK